MTSQTNDGIEPEPMNLVLDCLQLGPIANQDQPRLGELGVDTPERVDREVETFVADKAARHDGQRHW